MSRLRVFPAEPEVPRANWLSLYDPGEQTEPDWDGQQNDEPVLSFAELAVRVRVERTRDVVQRARLIHANSICPKCHRATVEVRDLVPAFPVNRLERAGGERLELQAVSRLGFYCVRCHAEWTA